MIDIFGMQIDIKTVLAAIGFFALIIIGWFVAKIVGWIVTSVLRKKPIALDAKMKNWKVDDAIGHASLSKILGKMMMWFVFAIFLSQAVSLINLGSISSFLNMIVVFIPKLIVALIIVIATLIIADFATDKIRATKSKLLDIVGIVLEPIIILFGVLIASEQVGIDLSFLMDIIRQTLQALSWGLSFAVAIAFGLSYGLDKVNSRSVLPDKLEKMWKKIK